ncbi:MAG: hypothetical protein LH478_13350 [Chitinophagaceae bacterium]|nr:hypothetical protein [Chitinophagaceae bacterium]
MQKVKILLKSLSSALIILITLCGLSINSNAQALDSKGTDFWLAFPGNFGANEFKLFISADQNTSGTVSVPGVAFSTPFTVTVGSVTTVILPGSVDIQTSNVIGNFGVHVVANQEVTVYALSRRQFTSDAYLGLPTDILGTEYIVLGYKNSNVINGTEFAIVASQNTTQVTITPTVSTDGRTAGVPYNINLNQGQTYQLRNTGAAPNDLSGTVVVSTKPIAVFGGHQCANIPPGAVACDFVVEQLPPTSAWGKNFVTVPLKTRRSGDTFRFLASTNSTEVRVNGALVATLNRGQLFETILTSSSQITSTQPILVAQYSNGTSFDDVTSDPFMMLITPYEQFLGNYTFATPAAGFRFNFVNVVSPASAVGAIKLDGVTIPAAAFTPIGSTGFSGAQLDLTAGTHIINGTNLPFGIFVYGFDFADSYGYPGGQSLAPIATVNNLTLTPKNASGTVGINRCFEALVKDQFSVPVVGVRVDFTITGANAGSTGFANTNASGIAQFCYTGNNIGLDNIIASVGTTSDATTFNWTSAAPATDYYSKAAGDLHNVLTWGVNLDGSGANPTDFGFGKTFHLVNRVPNYTMTADWTVDGIIDIPAGNILKINGFTLSEANLIGTGMLMGSATSSLIVTGSNGGNAGALNFVMSGRSLWNLTLNRTGTGASVNVGTPLDIYNVLNIVAGAFTTGNNITLKSSASKTARVAPVTGVISGNVTVERYIPARRAWRIMSAPVGGNQSINAAWQEGATTSSINPNPNPGFGTHITQGSAVNGYDFNPVIAMNSILKYNNVANNWGSLPNTNATNVNTNAYMLFVRGNRGITLGFNNVTPNNTILRSYGPLKTGDQLFNVSASGFTAIPNPYASPINFATLTRNHVQNNFYLWDPKLGGASGVGGYVLLSDNGAGGYNITPTPVSPESQLIQSGQGFLVRSDGTAGSLTIKESDKSATAATNVFRSSSNITRGLRTTLQVMDKGGEASVIDETFTAYGAIYSDNIDAFDPVKLENMNENLGTVRNGQTLMVERRQPVMGSDTIFLKLWNTEQKQYILQFTPENLNSTSVQTAVLIDNYLKTSTQLSLNEVTTVKINRDGNAASANPRRFMVVLTAARSSIPNDANIVKGTFKISPNPLSGKTLNIQFINQPKGVYNIELVNSLGQIILRDQIKYPGGNTMIPLQLKNAITNSVYQLYINNPANNVRTTIKVFGN